MLTEVPFSRFKLMKANEIKELQSFIVTSDGALLFYVAIPQNVWIKDNIEEYCRLSNIGGGKEVVLEKVAV